MVEGKAEKAEKVDDETADDAAVVNRTAGLLEQVRVEGDIEDCGYFDGSCGQRAQHLKALRHGSRTTIDQRLLERWSWALFLRDRFAPISGDGERPLRVGRTVAEVEFEALVALLEAYGRYAGQGPLLVMGDNQGVLALMHRVGRPSTGPLAALGAHATQLAQQVPLGVRYHWLPRSENRLTDRLASHSHAQQWGAEAIRCRHCAQRKPLWCPLSPAKVEA